MKLNNKKAFTLIELMIVVIIIGILAAIAIPAYQNFVFESKVAESSVQLDSLKTDQTAYFAESQVNAGGGYQTQSFYNVNEPQPSAIPAQTKATGTFTSPGWSALRFGPTDPLFFQYNSTAAGSGSSSTVGNTASGDLKASGATSYTVRTMTASVTNGGPTWGAIAKTVTE